MDARREQPDPRRTESQKADPLDDIELPDDTGEGVEEIDETAILDELLRDLAPELPRKEPDEKAAGPATTPKAEVTPPVQAARPEAGAAPPEDRGEAASYEEALTALTESEEPATAAVEAPKTVQPQAERPSGEQQGGIFTEAAIDEAFAALAGAEEPGAPAAETAAEAAQPEVAPEAEPAAEEAGVAIGAAVLEEAPVPPSAVTSAVARKESAEPAAPKAVPPEIVAGITRMVAKRYLGRLVQELGKEAKPIPEVVEAAVAAKAAPPRVKVEAMPPEEAPRPEEIEADLLHAAGLLEPEEEGKAMAAAVPEREPSIDDLIASAVTTPEEAPQPPAVPEVEQAVPEQVAPEPEAQPEETPVPEPVGVGEEDPLIREIRLQRRRRRIVWAGIAVAVIVAAGAWYFLSWRGPSPEPGAVTEQQPTEAVEQPQEAPPPEQATEAVQSASAELPVKPPQPSAPAAEPMPQPAAPAPTVAQGVPPKLPTSSGGQFTVHVESLAGQHGAQVTKTKWQRRGYEAFVWEYVRPSDGSRWYRIGVGRYATRHDGEAAKDLLKTAYPDEIDWSPVTKIPEGAM